jgi:VanZ family protein
MINVERIEKWLFRGASLAWIVLLSWESDRPGSEVHIEPPIDKVVHACAFGVLGFLLALGAGRLRSKILWLVPLMVSAFGFLDEFHQSFSLDRSVSAMDWLADTAGGVAAAVAWWLAWRQGRRQAA